MTLCEGCDNPACRKHGPIACPKPRPTETPKEK